MLDKINNQLKQALKDKDGFRLSVLRQLKTAISNEAISLKKKDKGLTEEESLKVLKREANKRKDAITAYIAGGREQLADQEKKELAIIEEYLPEQMSSGQIGEIVDKVIVDTGASSLQDFGRVMGQVMKQAGSLADGNVVSEVVKKRLKENR